MTKRTPSVERRLLKSMHTFLKTDIRHDPKFLPRPFIFELMGTPDSGKSTVGSRLDTLFRHEGFVVWRPPEGAEMVRDISRNTPRYNLATALYALENIVHQSERHEHDVFCVERGPFDAYTWMMYWHTKDKITEEEMRALQGFLKFRTFTEVIDVAIIMICQPEEAMRRHRRLAITKKEGKTTNPATITTLIERYKTAYQELKPEHAQLHLVDTTHMKQRDMVETVKTIVLNAFEQRISNSTP